MARYDTGPRHVSYRRQPRPSFATAERRSEFMHTIGVVKTRGSTHDARTLPHFGSRKVESISTIAFPTTVPSRSPARRPGPLGERTMTPRHGETGSCAKRTSAPLETAHVVGYPPANVGAGGAPPSRALAHLARSSAGRGRAAERWTHSSNSWEHLTLQLADRGRGRSSAAAGGSLASGAVPGAESGARSGVRSRVQLSHRLDRCTSDRPSRKLPRESHRGPGDCARADHAAASSPAADPFSGSFN